jgi:hypothetical protein
MPCDLLRQTLVSIESAASLTPTEWASLIGQARRVSLLARLAVLLEERNLLDEVPNFARRTSSRIFQ